MAYIFKEVAKAKEMDLYIYERRVRQRLSNKVGVGNGE